MREIILCTYDDDAGNALREDVATAFGRSRCKWVRYPKGCHDLNEALRQFGVRGVQETIRRAQWLAVPDIYAMSELPEPPENPAMDTGIVGLKEHFRVRRGDLTVVTGRAGPRQDLVRQRGRLPPRLGPWLADHLRLIRAAAGARSPPRAAHVPRPEAGKAPDAGGTRIRRRLHRQAFPLPRPAR